MSEGETDSKRGTRWAGSIFFWSGLVLCLTLFFHVPLAHRFDLLQTNAKDSRHLHFALEWGYSVLSGDERAADRGLWNAPIFFPFASASTLSDTHAGIAVLYAPFRWLGMAPASALQGVEIAMIALDYGALWFLARRGVALGPMGSAAAALLFAVAAPRAGKMNHFHLFAQFPSVLAIALMAEQLRWRRAARANWRIVLSAALLAWQFWCSIYLGALTALLLFLWVVAWVAVEPREALAVVPRSLSGQVALVLALVVAVMACVPLFVAYGEQAGRFGGSTYEELVPFLPRPISWIQPGRGAWLWSWIADLEVSSTVARSSAHRLGWGLLSPLIAALGFWTVRRASAARAAACAILAAALLATCWTDSYSAWRWIHEWIPGAPAIRAVGRIILVLLIPLSIFFGLGIARLAHRWGRIVAAAILLLCLAEQGRTLPGYPKERHSSIPAKITAALAPDCEAFFYSPSVGSAAVAHIDAMWAALESGIPTVNGFAAYPPPEWLPLLDPRVPTIARRAEIEEALRAWLNASRASDTHVCWVSPATGLAHSPLRATRVRLDESTGHSAVPLP